MARSSLSKTSIGSMLRSRPPKEQVVIIDRLLADPKLSGRARLPLQQLRSVLMFNLIKQAHSRE